MVSIKDKYRARVPKKCPSCGHSLGRSDSQNSLGNQRHGNNTNIGNSMGYSDGAV